MSLLSQFCNLFRSRRLSNETAEELEFHLDSRIRENIGSGMLPHEAEIDARRRMGNRTLAAENTREADILLPLQNALQDIRFASRLMSLKPMFTLMLVLLLTLGIGVSTAMFSLLLRAVFPRSAFENTARLVLLWTFDAKENRYLERFSDSLARSRLDAVRHQNRRLARVSFYRFAGFTVSATGRPEFVPGLEIESDWLPALGVHPILGRNLSPGESNVVLVTTEFAKKVFHRASDIAGRTIRVDNRPFTLIGVLPAGIDFDGAQIFVPLSAYANSYSALGNLQKGFTLQQAQAEANDSHIHLATWKEKLTNDCGPTCAQQHQGVWLLFAAALFVTLLACANVGNLLLVRTIARRQEFAIRGFIGCSRSRLLAQLLTESAVLFLCGGLLAVPVASGIAAALDRFAAAYTEPSSATRSYPLDHRAFAFTVFATLTTALLFGVLPAVRSTSAFRKRAARKPLFPARTRGLLVSGECALSVVLLVGLGLLLRSFLAVESIPVGINRQRLLTISANLAKQYDSAAKRISFASRLLETVRDLPAVSSAALTSSLPLTGADDAYLRIEGRSSAPVEVRYLSVSTNFFAALQLPILAGRPLSDHDSTASTPVVVINRTMAHLLFPDGGALGQRIQIMDENPRVWRQIVGIAADVRQRNLEEDPRPVFYRPFTQGLDSDLTVAVRVRSDAGMSQAARALQTAITKANPDIAWEPIKSMRQVIYDSESLSLRRPVIRLLSAFGFLALLLTAAGLFAVLSYSVAARTRELGIRMAIGARPTQILQQILGETFSFVFIGALAGCLSAYTVSRLLPSGHIGWSGSGIFLYGIGRLDALTYGSVLCLLCLLCLFAASLPARRAVRIDPNTALREE